MLKLKINFSLVFLICFISVLVGCVAIEPEVREKTIELPEPERVGVYHKVKRGETLWRIAKTYDVSIEDIIKSNNIPDVAQVEVNQLLFIPGVDKTKEVIVDVKDDNQKDFSWPLKGKIIRYFRDRSNNQTFKGISIQTSPGQEVKAARSGQVVFADYLNGYGYTVIIDHADGFHTVYANNAQLLVKLDDFVFKGKPVALVGKKDALTYLHFEVRRNSVADNPLYYLP